MAAKDLSTTEEEFTKVIINELEILDIFHELQETNARFLVWRKQKSPEEARVRCVMGILSSNLVENEVMFIDLSSGSKTQEHFSDESELFCFNPDKNILFKAAIKDIKATKLLLDFPIKLNVISAKNVKIILPELSDPKLKHAFHKKEKEKSEAPVSTDNQEKAESVKKEAPTGSKDTVTPSSTPEPKTEESPQESDDPAVDYTAIRSAPRGKSSGDQVVEVVYTSGPRLGEKGYFELYDLSVGGLSFIVFDEEEIPKGTTLNITNLGGAEKNPPLKAEAVSFSELGAETGEFKIGLKFI